MNNLITDHPGLESKVNIGYAFENWSINVFKVHRCSGDFSSRRF